jgi:hypothetical protein
LHRFETIAPFKIGQSVAKENRMSYSNTRPKEKIPPADPYGDGHSVPVRSIPHNPEKGETHPAVFPCNAELNLDQLTFVTRNTPPSQLGLRLAALPRKDRTGAVIRR